VYEVFSAMTKRLDEGHKIESAYKLTGNDLKMSASTVKLLWQKVLPDAIRQGLYVRKRHPQRFRESKAKSKR
jgi:hypothetical protein